LCAPLPLIGSRTVARAEDRSWPAQLPRNIVFGNAERLFKR
jgi:hypothetical protein